MLLFPPLFPVCGPFVHSTLCSNDDDLYKAKFKGAKIGFINVV
jgi:hypothetical protein